MLKMLAVRAQRESALAFYNKFTKIKVDYLAAAQKKFKPSFKLSKNLNLKQAKFLPAFGIDPGKIIFGRYNNLSLVNIEGLEKLIKDADVVNITDTYYWFNRQAIKLAKKHNKKIVTIIWMTLPNHPSTWLPFYKNATKAVVNSTDLFILRCNSAYRFTDSLKITRSKTIVIYKGIDVDMFKSVKRDKNTDIVNILYTGIYHSSKGLDDLLWAFTKLSKQDFPVSLTLAGKGPMKNKITKLSKKYKIYDCGFVKYKKLAKVYQSADIFCSPSKPLYWFGLKVWEEYFSYTLMEAQASGLPIVTTKTGGIPEEVDSRNYLVEPCNRKAIYKALKELVISSEKRKKISRINRSRAEKLFDAKKQAKLTEDEILKIC